MIGRTRVSHKPLRVPVSSERPLWNESASGPLYLAKATSKGQPMADDNPRSAIKPFLIQNDDDGKFRLTVRTTHYNSWNYPIVNSSVVEESFATAGAARAHAKEHFGAQAGQFATK